MQPDIKLIEAVSGFLVSELGEDFDAETFWDTLDGETDAIDLIDHILASMQDDAALADAAKSQATAIAARAKRITERAAAKKKTLKLILDATGQKKVERPRGTVSKMAGRVSVEITDENAIPTQLCVTKIQPDKSAIKKQLDAGEDVPGARLVRGSDTVSVRVA